MTNVVKITKRIDGHPPSVRCAWCRSSVIGDLLPYGRLPASGVLFSCETCRLSLADPPAYSVAFKEDILDRLQLEDVDAVEIRSEPFDPTTESGAGVITRLKTHESASVTEEKWLQHAYYAGLSFEEFWRLAKKASASGEELDEYLEARRRVDDEGRITYEENEA